MSFPITEANYSAEKNRVEEIGEDAQGHWATLSGQALQATVAKTGGTNANAEDTCLPWCQPSKARSRNVFSLWLMGQGTTRGPSLKSDLVSTTQTMVFSSLSVSQVGDSGRPFTPMQGVLQNSPGLRGSHLSLLLTSQFRDGDCVIGQSCSSRWTTALETEGQRGRQTQRALFILGTSLHPRVKKTYCIRNHDQDPPPCLSRQNGLKYSEITSQKKILPRASSWCLKGTTSDK